MINIIDSEKIAQDKILLRRIYVDICGDISTALILSQIIYWNIPDSKGKNKLQVKKEGEYCLVKKNSDWFNECRVNERTAQRSLKKLSELKIIRTARHKFKNTPMVHIWLNEVRLNEIITNQLNINENNSDSDKMSDLIRTKCPDEFGQNGQIFITDTTTDTTSDTTFINGAKQKNVLPLIKNNFEINLNLINKELSTFNDNTANYDKKVIKEMLIYYLKRYEDTFNEQHPILKKEYWKRVINDLFINPVSVFLCIPEDSEGNIFKMIDAYFSENIDCDYNILHFATEGILDNRFYEACY